MATAIAILIAIAGGVGLARAVDRDNRQRFAASVDLFESVLTDQVAGYRTVEFVLPTVLGSVGYVLGSESNSGDLSTAGGGVSVVAALPLEGLAGVGLLRADEDGARVPLMLPNNSGLTNDVLVSDVVMAAVDRALSTGSAQLVVPSELPGAVTYVYAVAADESLEIVEFIDVSELLSALGLRSDARLVETLATDAKTGREVASTGKIPTDADPFETIDVSILGRSVALELYPGEGFDWSPGWIPGVWFSVLCLAIAGLIYLVGILTRRRNVEQEARLQLATRIIKDKDRFIAAVSHELRTPLTAVVGLAEELATSLQAFSEEELQELTEIVAQESREMALLVEDLLVAGRMEDGQVTINAETLDVDEQIRSVQAGIGAIGAQIVVGESGTSAWADPLRVRQIVRNLAINAVRHGGPSIYIQASNGADRTYIEVCDDGGPVSAEARERMFEPYYRSATSNGQAPSVGLGLSVSHRLAEMMDSRLTYRHENGWGVFRLDLPAHNPEAVERHGEVGSGRASI